MKGISPRLNFARIAWSILRISNLRMFRDRRSDRKENGDIVRTFIASAGEHLSDKLQISIRLAHEATSTDVNPFTMYSIGYKAGSKYVLVWRTDLHITIQPDIPLSC